MPSPDASSEKAETEPQKQLQDAAPEDKPAEASAGQGAQEEEFITGFKLAIVLVAVTLVAFLMLLDTSIVATVRFLPLPQFENREVLILYCAGHTSNNKRFPRA